MKQMLLFAALLLLFIPAYSQVLLDDNEGSTSLSLQWSSGFLVRNAVNPLKNGSNQSPFVAKYTRTNAAYCGFALKASAPSKDLGPYATYDASAKRFKMDFYSQYPGTKVQITIQNSGMAAAADFPVGRHSEYSATSTKTNEWETLVFKYVWTPDKSVPNDAVDEFIIFIQPGDGTASGRTYYLDNFMGPESFIPELSEMLYEDAEAVSLVNYKSTTGDFSKGVINPASNSVNSSAQSLRYVRSTKTVDTVIMSPAGTIHSLRPFLNGKKKMTLQVYSSKAGSKVQLSFLDKDSRSGTTKGIHSVFEATTKKVREWETLLFDYIRMPDAGVKDTEIDEIHLNIANGSTKADTFFLDNFYGPDLFVPQGTVVLHLNEVSASNFKTKTDEDGDASDWIEIYNSGDGSANLKGYRLSDDKQNPSLYRLPDLFIYPGDHIILWASDKDTVFPSGEIHTNFKLSNEGERLLLSSPEGDTIDLLNIPALSQDISYGRITGYSDSLGYFLTPTPGSPNISSAYAGYVKTLPVFSMKGGFYEKPFDLNLTAVTGMEIRYTLDGSDPSTESSLVTGTLPITSNAHDPNSLSTIRTTYINYPPFLAPSDTIFKATTVKARVFKEGLIPGPVLTNTYFVDEKGRNRYSLPVWSIVTDSLNLFDYEKGIYIPGKLYDDWRINNPTAIVEGNTPSNYTQKGDEWEKPVSIEFFEPGNFTGIQYNAGIKIHGNYSRANPQKSLRLYFRDGYGADVLNYPVFPGLKGKTTGKKVDEFKKILLRNSGGDNFFSYFLDALSQSLVAHTSVLTSSYRPSVLFLNGEYWGLINIRERYDKDFIVSHYDVADDDIAILSFNGTIEEGSQEDANDYLSMVNYISTNDITDPVVWAYASQKMDITNFIEYNIAEIYLNNRDWPGNNVYYWKNRKGNPASSSPGPDGRWRWILMDTDFGMGWPLGDVYPPTYNMIKHATAEGNTEWPNPDWATLLFRTLLKNNTFRNEFINRFADHLNSSFKTSRVIAKIDSMKAALNPEMQEHYKRWHPNTSLSFWEGNVQLMRNFAKERPIYQRQHITDFFSLTGVQQVTLDVKDNTGGSIKISSIKIDRNLPGVEDGVYPWTGIYFKDVPLTITAIPDRGYKFAGWNGNPSSDSDTTLVLASDTKLVAYFVPLDENDKIPFAHNLAKSDYEMKYWSASSEAGSYPASMIFMQTDTIDPKIDVERNIPYTLAYNLTKKTRIEGLNDDGFAFINTGSISDEPNPGRDLGAAVLALKTKGLEQATVSFTAGTVLPNDRSYGIRLQYRIGDNGAFTDFMNNGNLVDYIRTAEGGKYTRFENIPLSEELMNQEYIQLRWVYYYISGNSGPRAKLRLDDISVSALRPSAVADASSDLNQVSIFPNPSNGSFTFRLSNEFRGMMNIAALDITGKTICSTELNKQSKEIYWHSECDFTGPGFYFLKWSTGEVQGFEKIIVNK
ncbi:MAG: CotH kinase family protein [Sporocytophaga sp.]|uniref:CotH kinase family protein n=1 Tax=Sporocytophaga sp. TaxID=2231183 RepID=UPI001B1A1AB4|nr:CotH kinase family protein [Sporocytophaga sp.]MBO9703376.1 CotH kinase family protein [Sporocytophaga sp.]